MMAEEDEIDIMGDFSLESYLECSSGGVFENETLVENADILNCNYTIHPQWLLDKPSPNPDSWYGPPSEETWNKPQNDTASDDNTSMGHLSTENAVTDESGWTEKEKSLLERGIEIFGKSTSRVAQFVGSKTPSEVKYYLKNFYLQSVKGYSGVMQEVDVSSFVTDVIDANEIPVSLEEVIAVVSTAQPTIPPTIKKGQKCNILSSNNYGLPSFPGEISNGIGSVKHNTAFRNGQRPNKVKSKQSDSKYKCQTVKVKTKKHIKFKFKPNPKLALPYCKPLEKQTKVKVHSDIPRATRLGAVEITTGNGLTVPFCEGEQLVKISKELSESEEEIEVDDSPEIVPVVVSRHSGDRDMVHEAMLPPEEDVHGTENESNLSDNAKKSTLLIDLNILDDSLVEELLALTVPQNEVVLEECVITELEKVIHSEFFEGKPAKNPLRYRKIRNHIINSWLCAKPSYVTKTSVRQGLKNCGDVNCISRIHCFLEQLGVINFGCSQVTYIRPLYDLFQMQASPNKSKGAKDENRSTALKKGRPRHKRVHLKDGSGGCTLTHNEHGDVIDTVVVSEKPAKPKTIRKPSIPLLYCRNFAEDKDVYSVEMHLTTLLLMDIHAHTSLSEIMGLVAGKWDPVKTSITISHYEPCHNSASSLVHCDMCPISQSKAAHSILDRGLNIMGWYHSHPTFAPEPSQQDLETQQIMQTWIGHDVPCVGVILSPFSANRAPIASPFRCMMVKKENGADKYVPYKYKVRVVPDLRDVESFLRDVEKILTFEDAKNQVAFSEKYFQDNSITYLQKFLSSIQMHLAKWGHLDRSTCDYVIKRVREVCEQRY